MEQAISLLLQKCKANNLHLDPAQIQQLTGGETQSGEQSDQLKRDYEVALQNLKIRESELQERLAENNNLTEKIGQLERNQKTREKEISDKERKFEIEIERI